MFHWNFPWASEFRWNPPDNTVKEEIIWSDGPSSEFKDQFMRQLLENLSKKHGKAFIWKFFVTSHGKGVVDGVGEQLSQLQGLQ